MTNSLLFVEDSIADTEIYKAKFSQCDLSFAENYTQAVNLCAECDYVIVDVNLQGENGYEVQAKLKKEYPEKNYIITSSLFPRVSISTSTSVALVGKEKLVEYLQREFDSGPA